MKEIKKIYKTLKKNIKYYYRIKKLWKKDLKKPQLN